MSLLGKIRTIAKQKGYTIYSRPYELNIWGIRSKQTRANKFDDEIHVFYKTGFLDWEYHVFHATTDPGTYWLESPLNEQGTAILKQGQYVNAYGLGMHRGKYIALTQQRPVTVYRDYNRNAKLDFFNGTQITGLFGINIHRAMVSGTTRYVDQFSAGCQVFANGEDFAKFIGMCEKHRQLYGNQFTYTLIDQRAIRRALLRKLTIGTLTLGSGLLTYFLITNQKTNQNEKQQTPNSTQPARHDYE